MHIQKYLLGSRKFFLSFFKMLPPSIGVYLFLQYNKIFIYLHKPHWVTTFFGGTMLCNPYDYIQRMIFYFGVWEPDISYWTSKLLSPGDVYVDIGANIGYYTLLASRCVGESGKVVSIEASPSIFSLLSTNIQANKATNVRAVNQAAADCDTMVSVYIGPENNLGSSTTEQSRGARFEATVKANALNSILVPDEISRVRLIKIDVEGTELTILNQFIATLEQYPAKVALIVEANAQDNPDGWEEVFKKLQEVGFQAYQIANTYRYAWYMQWEKASPLKLMHTAPKQLTDILFLRQPFPID